MLAAGKSLERVLMSWILLERPRAVTLVIVWRCVSIVCLRVYHTRTIAYHLVCGAALFIYACARRSQSLAVLGVQ